ncbi:MAG TPA: DNA-processing protein DprA [Blastocatellia bacterium]|nr:DNA-processing protein DprA [Blastocatellia bacterium]
MEPEISIRDWVALSLVKGVGRRSAALLLEKFGTPGNCFDASERALLSAGVKRETIEELKRGEPRSRADRELDELKRMGASVLALGAHSYPALLRETYDPPIVLYCLGDPARAFAQPCVAIVGSRHCSTYGRNVAGMLGRELGERGVTIVSGLARGIDTAAHRGAIESGGITIAVMGTGLDLVYPKENRKLSEEIARHGAIMSEFPLGTPPLPQNFPFRNRVISGVTLGVLVVEGAERSGSLITARMAYEQGRDVFAVPGNITSSKSFGPNYLIKDGARLVQSWRDVVDEFPSEIKSSILAREGPEQLSLGINPDEFMLSELERELLGSLKPDEPVHIDQLILSIGPSPGELMSALLKLEMMERIKQLPGKSFVLKV